MSRLISVLFSAFADVLVENVYKKTAEQKKNPYYREGIGNFMG
jgi:hypothetical protein